jgi:hypothetical protein
LPAFKALELEPLDRDRILVCADLMGFLDEEPGVSPGTGKEHCEVEGEDASKGDCSPEINRRLYDPEEPGAVVGPAPKKVRGIGLSALPECKGATATYAAANEPNGNGQENGFQSQPSYGEHRFGEVDPGLKVIYKGGHWSFLSAIQVHGFDSVSGGLGGLPHDLN